MSDINAVSGDIVHLPAGDNLTIASDVISGDGGKVILIPDAPTVAQLLASSRAAHQRFQRAAGHNDGRGHITTPDDAAAATAIHDALTARESAEAADIDHADPAWTEDKAANNGVDSATLLHFYRDYFAPDVPL